MTQQDGLPFVLATESDSSSRFLAPPELIRLLRGSRLPNAIRLSSIASLSYPGSVKPRAPPGPTYETSYDLIDKRYGIMHVRQVPLASLGGRGFALLPPGWIAVGRIRPYLANIAVVPTLDGPVLSGSEWIVLNQTKGLNYLLAHLVRREALRGRLSATTGQTRPRMPLEALAELELPWPESERAAIELNESIRQATLRRNELDQVFDNLVFKMEKLVPSGGHQ